MDINKYGIKGKLSISSVNSVADLDESDIYEVLWLAKNLKRRQNMKENLKDFEGKNVVIMLGSKNSNMRISFELAVGRLGGKTLYLSPADDGFLSGLTYKDVMIAISRYGANGMVVKENDKVDAGISVINLGNGADVCNVLANLMTVWEKTGKLSGVKMLSLGSGSALDANEANAYSKCGVLLTVICKKEDMPDEDTVEEASQFGDITISDDLYKYLGQTDIISSAHSENGCICVTQKIMNAAPDAYYLHSLPIRHGEEVEESVLYGEKSLVFEQTENLIYIEQALMLLLFGN